MKAFLQTKADLNVWEEVDEYTYLHRKEALNEAGNGPRYTESAVLKDESGIHLHLADVSEKDLGIIVRFLGVSVATGNYPGGNCRQPAFVNFRNRQGSVRLRMANGDIYKKAA